MAKRKLNRRQQWRIQKIQQERLDRAQKKLSKLSDSLDHLDDTHYHGLVISHFGATLDIEKRAIEKRAIEKQDIENNTTSEIIRCALRQNIESIVCGDNVIWQKIKDLPPDEQIQGVVTALEPRKNVLARPDFTGQMKPVAANIDQILIITSPIPELNEGLIDRYLVAAELSGINAVLVLNKIDVLTDDQLEQLSQRIQIYQAIGYPIIYTSAKVHNGLDSLYQQLNNKSSVFVGQSGVGKSSLINALLPEARIKEGEVSDATQKGTHTTSVSRLYHLENKQVNNAIVIDSPGVREFGLWDIDKNDVIHGFRELEEYAQSCRFRDCKHINEPGCSILEALESGKISRKRYESYHRIMESLN